jgi:hypothetical protein
MRVFQTPVTNGAMTDLSQVLERAYPDLKGRPEFYETLCTDLFQKGLVTMESLQGIVGQVTSTVTDRRSTALGDLFLKFIAEQVDDSA